MKLSFSTLACDDWDLEKIADTAQSFGYQGVELRVNQRHLNPDSSSGERKFVRKVFRQRDLEIVCLAGYTRFGFAQKEARTEQVKDLCSLIDLAQDLECPYVRTFGAGRPVDYKREQIASWIGESLLAADDYASARSVKVLLETHDLFSTGAEVSAVFGGQSDLKAGVLWDVKHSLFEGESIDATLGFVGERIFHVHLKDWLTVPGSQRENLVLLGAGELPLSEVLDKLRGLGYRGYLSLEWEKLWHPELEDSYLAIYQYSQKMRGLLGHD